MPSVAILHKYIVTAKDLSISSQANSAFIKSISATSLERDAELSFFACLVCLGFFVLFVFF